mmetsp:Transcript_71527/g.202919  ORF Transcript_71527/g.202919 Transcript_71527/m.202919 type:complete len:310 (-) Transcript_71527:72-1001(-)
MSWWCAKTMAFSSPRSSTSRRYSLTAGSFARAVFWKRVETASPPHPPLSTSCKACISLRISFSSLASETSTGIRWRRLGGSCDNTSFFSLRTITVLVSSRFSSEAFRAPTTLLTVRPPKICCCCWTQYRVRNSWNLAGIFGSRPLICGCSSSGEFLVGVPESRIERRARCSMGTTARVLAALHSLMLWLSSAMMMVCGEPSGRNWNFPFLKSVASRLYEMTQILALESMLSAPFLMTWTLSGPTSHGSHCSACSFQTHRREEGHTTMTGQSSTYCAARASPCNVFPRPISSPMRQRPPRLVPNLTPSSW